MDLGRRPLVLFGLFAVAVAIEAAWLAPAALLDPRVADATRGALRVAGAEGTLWHGRGVIAAANARIPIEWDVDVLPLLRGALHLRVRSPIGAASPRGTVSLRANGVTLHDADFTIPAGFIAAALGEIAAGSVDGDVEASTADLELAAGANRGEARLVWRAARIAGVGGVGPLDLGDVQATLVAKGAVISGSLNNDGGSVALRGEWALREQKELSLAMRISPRRADQVELTRWLSAIGTADGDGWRATWTVPLR